MTWGYTAAAGIVISAYGEYEASETNRRAMEAEARRRAAAGEEGRWISRIQQQAADLERQRSLVGAEMAGMEARTAGAKADMWRTQSRETLQENEDFAVEQFNSWESTFGNIQKNMANFYKNLSPEQMTATGLDLHQKQYQAKSQELEKIAAQKGYSSPALGMMKQNLEMQNAEAKTKTRFEAPFKLAEAQQNAVRSAVVNPYADRVSAARQGVAIGEATQSAAEQSREVMARNREAAATSTAAQFAQTGLTAGAIRGLNPAVAAANAAAAASEQEPETT